MEKETLEEIKKAAYEGAKEGSSKIIVKKGSNRIVSFLIKVVLVIVVISLVPLAFSNINPFSKLADQFSQEKDVEGYDLTLENNGIFGYKAADFAEVILGDSTQLKLLEVYQQEMSEMVSMTKAGFMNWKIFSKSKYYTFHGTATYTIDLSDLNEKSISLDEENNTVILKIPHATVLNKNMNIPVEEMEVGDTEKGLLAFGDLNLSDDEIKEVVKEAKSKMKEKLASDNIQDCADNVGKMVIWEIYQPLISKAFPGITLDIEFIEES